MKQKIELGTVILHQDGTPYTGGFHTAGAKVYKSEAMARSAVKRKIACGAKYTFLPAYAEIDHGVKPLD